MTEMWSVSVVDDPYLEQLDDTWGEASRPLRNGDVIRLTRRDVHEIPTEWPGNANLAAHAVITGARRDVTGLLSSE